MTMRIGRAAAVAAIGAVGLFADTTHAALAKASGGSGYSGKLSSNKTVRKQQLICDPATNGPSALANGAPKVGSTSVNYDPGIVSLAGLAMSTGYAGSGVVEVTDGEATFLQDIQSFLEEPAGRETGYAQVFYHHGPIPGSTGGSTGPGRWRW